MATGFSYTTEFNPWEVPTEPVKRFTVEEYFQMVSSGLLEEDAPFELLEGWLVRKMPRGSAHELALGRLNRVLQRSLSLEWHCRVQSALVLSDGVPEPDLAIVIGPDERYEARLPHAADAALVIEVSDTTLARDRGPKMRSYARAGIPEYWIVNVEERQVEVYNSPVAIGAYAEPMIYHREQSVPLTLQGRLVFEISVSSLFASEAGS
jgi:Uma2 family endonuclease